MVLKILSQYKSCILAILILLFIVKYYKKIENFNVVDVAMNSLDVNNNIFNNIFGKITGTDVFINKNIINNGIRFTSGWTAYPDSAKDKSEISNDTNGYKTLMIVGNKSAGAERRVAIWDKLNIHGNMEVDGKISVGGTTIDGTDLNKMKSVKMLAGYAINGGGTTILLFEGGWHNLYDTGDYGSPWTNDNIDIAYIFKGWKLELADDGDGKGFVDWAENKTKDVMRKTLQHMNRVSSYKMTWVGY